MSFGPTVSLSLDYTPAGLVRGPTPSVVAVLSQETPELYFYTLSANGQFVQTDRLAFSEPATAIASGMDMQVGEFTLLSMGGDSVTVLQRVKNTFVTKQMPIEPASQCIVYGDLNNDKRRDLMLFGKKRTGITTLLGQKNNSFTTGPLLFPDLSISSARCADLNGDGITDLFALNWLSNQLALFYGIGQGVFTEQVGVTLPGEPAELAITPVGSGRTMQLAVTLPDERTVCVFRANATGEIEQTEILRFTAAPLHVAFAHVNGDKVIDLIVTTDSSVFVYLNTSATKAGTPIIFGVGSGLRQLLPMDIDGDNLSDLVAIDGKGRRIIAYANSDWSGSVEWPSTYGVGNAPTAVSTIDINNDHRLDILVANSGSSTLSVLLNRGKGRFSGQIAVPVAEMPMYVKPLGSSGRTHFIATTHLNVDKLTILRLTSDVTATGVFSLPTGTNPYVVTGTQDSTSEQLELLVRYTHPRDQSPSLSQFKQIGGGQFIEQSLRVSLPGRITALTVNDYSGTGKNELVFATNDLSSRVSALSIAFASQGFDFKTAKRLLSFVDSTGCVRSIVSGFVDGDQHKDLVLIMVAPRNALGIVYGKGGGAFTDSMEIIHNVQPFNEDAVLLKDANGDGYGDITWIDAGENAVVTLTSKGNRRFDQPRIIYSADQMTAIQIASVKAPGIQDMIIANGSNGTVTMVFDPFR